MAEAPSSTSTLVTFFNFNPRHQLHPSSPLSSTLVAFNFNPHRQLHPSVTELPKIILYDRLSLSTWPLSNNKELFCHFHRVKPGKSLTTGSRYALSPHEGGTKVQHYIKVSQVQHYYKPSFSYIKVKVIRV
jgi:hypothetical protein